MKSYKIAEGKYLVTNGTMVFESAVPVFEKNTNKVSRLILISEKYYKSVQALKDIGIKTDYADPELLEYIIKNDVITVSDGEHKFTVSKADKDSTIVFIKSGYSQQILAYLYEELAKLGVLVINTPNAVANTANKWITYELLQNAGFPQPTSVLVSSNDVSKKDDSLLIKKLRSIYKKEDDSNKYVCKLLKSHGGHGVFCCREKNIVSILQAIFAVKDTENILIQKALDIKDGDIRVNVLTIDGKQTIINAVKRSGGSSGDFRTNLSLGGHSEEITLTKEQERLAYEAAKVSGLTWAGVDILEDKTGKLYIIEVNGAPGTPFDVEDQEDLLKKNTEFYASLIKKIDSLK